MKFQKTAEPTCSMHNPVFTRGVTVRHSDVDAMGWSRIPSFIGWMEETEYAFLRSLRLSVSMNDQRGQFGFPRLKTEIDVMRPVRVDEDLDVGLEIGRFDAKQIEYRFEIRQSGPGTSEPIGTGRFEVACCRFPSDALPFAILIPEAVLKLLEQAKSGEADQLHFGR